MKEPTMEEVLKLVTFDRDEDGELFVRSVAGSVWGSVGGTVSGTVLGNVYGNVGGTVEGTIGGREWEFVETPEEKAIRLIRERLYEEEIMALEEDE
jgi:hypothetical protein